MRLGLWSSGRHNDGDIFGLPVHNYIISLPHLASGHGIVLVMKGVGVVSGQEKKLFCSFLSVSERFFLFLGSGLQRMLGEYL